MNIKFQRAVDRLAGVPICALFSLVSRLSNIFGAAARPAPPRRILVILLSEMGSLVLAHPMFMRLKQNYPDASLHVMLFGKNREVLDLMEVTPQENVLTINDRTLSSFARDSLRAIARMRALRLDVVIDCELFSRVSSIFSWLSGAPVRVGFHRHTQEGLYRGSFINRPVLYNPYRHLSQQFLTMAAAIESDTVPKAKEAATTEVITPPALNFSGDELHKVFTQLHDDFPAIAEKKLVLVYPSGGILPIRAWPMENYRQLCASLLIEGYAVGIIGLKDDKPYGRDIVTHCQSPYCIDLTGYTKSVRHLLALFHRASLLVTNDGGPGQFAALTPVPSLVFFGPETPVLYGSLARNSHCFFASLPCSPCLTAYNHRSSPCDGDNRCLKQVTPGQVLAKAREILGIAEAGRLEGARIPSPQSSPEGRGDEREKQLSKPGSLREFPMEALNKPSVRGELVEP